MFKEHTKARSLQSTRDAAATGAAQVGNALQTQQRKCHSLMPCRSNLRCIPVTLLAYTLLACYNAQWVALATKMLVEYTGSVWLETEHLKPSSSFNSH